MRRLIILLLSTLLIFSCSTTTRTENKSFEIAQDSKSLGEAYMNQGNYTAALKELMDAEKTLPNDPYLQNDLGLVYLAKQRLDLAERHFSKAIALKPDYIPAKNNLGTVYLKQNRWDDAINLFKVISENLLYATPHFSLTNLGWAYLGKQNFIQARDSFHKALKFAPDFVNAIHGLATVYIRTQQSYLAEPLLLKALKSNPNAVILHADLATAYETMHQLSKAKQSWQTVLQLEPIGPLSEEAELRIRHIEQTF